MNEDQGIENSKLDRYIRNQCYDFVANLLIYWTYPLVIKRLYYQFLIFDNIFYIPAIYVHNVKAVFPSSIIIYFLNKNS